MKFRDYITENDDFKKRFKNWRDSIDKNLSTEEQMKKVIEMEKKGYKIVIWEPNFVAMMDKKNNPAEVYKNGKVKYPKKNI